MTVPADLYSCKNFVLARRRDQRFR
uniref:Uncharacterized protein n=1 Tax=Rhizophora mucronata TaxID=61149 RepID=A0A2P2NKR1_RHIMU